MNPRFFAIALALSSASLVLPACSGEDTDEVAVDVTVRGPHEVGIRTESLTYRPNGIDSDRTLRVVVWYPTAATTGDRGSYLGTRRSHL